MFSVVPNDYLGQQSQFYFFVTQSEEDSRGNGQTVKLSKLNGLKKTEQEDDVREMITPSLREALTKQGGKKKVICAMKHCYYYEHFIFNFLRSVLT